MKRLLVVFFATSVALLMAQPLSAGWISNLLGRGKQDEQQPANAITKAQDSGVAQKSDKTTANPTPTPNPDDVKKLRAALDWEKPPKDLFERYAGTWQGDFWVYSTEGRLEQHNKVRITYTLQQDGTLKMDMLTGDLISKLWVTKVTATYEIEGNKILCTVTQPTGETFKQIGHYNDGSVFFVSQISDGVEHQRERIDGKRLLVDGFGVYGSLKKKDDHHVFIGRFLKQD